MVYKNIEVTREWILYYYVCKWF